MTPQGKSLTQSLASCQLVKREHLIVICGHYEGIDHRVVEHLSILRFRLAITF